MRALPRIEFIWIDENRRHLNDAIDDVDLDPQPIEFRGVANRVDLCPIGLDTDDTERAAIAGLPLAVGVGVWWALGPIARARRRRAPEADR